MTFIEDIFGVAPDAGSGALEFALVIVPLAAIAFIALRRWRRSSIA